MTPLQRYWRDLEQKGFTPDPAQQQLAQRTESLYQRLLAQRRSLWWRRLAPWPGGASIKGLYVWGGVGRGKTWLVDGFHDCLPRGWGLRLHFHRFMRRVHSELRQLPQRTNPLRLVVRRLFRSGKVRVLCLDEFHVVDIADAMLLSGLLHALLARRIILLCTSNEHPDVLYRDGLQRQRFLPAIALLKEHTRLVQLESGADYRLRRLEQAEVCHVLQDWERGDELLHAQFAGIAGQAGSPGGELEINRRFLPVVRAAPGVVWFTFSDLCDGPRGVSDYIELARCYHTVFLSQVPIMSDAHDEQAKRFIDLVDEFYDRRVNLILTAASAPDGLYLGRRLRRAFQRTRSRLQEMCSHDYLSSPHLS